MPEFLASLSLSELSRLLSCPEDKAKGFSDTGARIHLLLDVAVGKVRSQRHYARRWGWNRNTIRYRWPEIWQPVALWATSYGRQADPAKYSMAANLPAPWLAWVRHPENPVHATSDVPSSPYHPPYPPLTPQKVLISGEFRRSTT